MFSNILGISALNFIKTFLNVIVRVEHLLFAIRATQPEEQLIGHYLGWQDSSIKINKALFMHNT